MAVDWLRKQFRFGGSTEVTIADSGTATTASDEEAACRLIVLTGALSDDRFFVLPLDPGCDWVVANTTTGGYAVTVQGASGAGVSIPSDNVGHVVSDGTDILSASLVGTGIIANVNVSASAAIAGSKIDPTFTDNVQLAGGAKVSWFASATDAKAIATRHAREVSTTNATATIIDAFTATPNAIIDVDVLIVAMKDDATAQWRQSYSATFRSNGVGTATQMGANTTGTVKSNGTVAGIAAAIAASGDQIETKVTGRAAENWRWTALVALTQRT